MPTPATATVTVLMGVSGVGKSTWLAANPDAGERITFDAIRRAGRPPGAIIARSRARAVRLATAGTPIVVDACNLSTNHRAWALNLAAEAGATTRLVVLHPPSLEELTARQRTRGAEAMPLDALSRQLRQWPQSLREVTREPWGSVTHVGTRSNQPPEPRASRDW